MKRFKYLTLAALVAFAACDEGEETITPPPVTGSITGVVSIEGAGVAGITVSLSSGATATTDASGAFTFSGVDAGAYTVSIAGYPADATFSSTAQAATITSAGQVVSLNFSGAFVRTSAIIGSVAASGTGVPNVSVSIGASETLTDDNGQFAFSGLRAGSYTVDISGFDPTMYSFTNTSSEVSVAVGESKVVAFSGTLVSTATVSGRLYIDENDTNENYDGPALEDDLTVAGVLIGLEVAIGDTIFTETDADGLYSFMDLEAGTYKVIIDPDDTDLPGNVAYGSASTTQLVSITTGATGMVDWPFVITQQAIQVYGFLGVDGVNPGITPIEDWTINLYDTEANAAAGGTTGRLDKEDTDAGGGVIFRFDRDDDISPNADISDDIVFAQVAGPPSAGHAMSGETILEIRYNAKDSLVMANDTLDALFGSAKVALRAHEIDGDTLSGWEVRMHSGKDTTVATTVSLMTNAKGDAVFNLDLGITAGIGSDGMFPDTVFLRLRDAQAGANGHAWSQTPTAEEGTATGRWVRVIWDGTTSMGDTIWAGTDMVSYKDADLLVRVHRERDDTTGVTPTYTGGDDFGAITTAQVELFEIESDGDTVSIAGPTAAAALDGTVLFPNLDVSKTWLLKATTTDPNMFVLDDMYVMPALDGSDQSFTGTELKGSAGASTFAIKSNNNNMSGKVMSKDGVTPVEDVVVTIMPTGNIQGTPMMVDTTSATGAYVFDKLVEGPYTVSVDAMGEPFVFLNTLTTTDVPLKSGDADNAAPESGVRDLQGYMKFGTVNFEAYRTDISITGVVVNDRDSDLNVIDPGEALAGAVFELYMDDDGSVTRDTLIGTATSDANGKYMFENLREGQYMVRWVAGTPNADQDVLRALSTDSVIVTTMAADPTFGTASPVPLPRWDYSTAAGVGGNEDPAHFMFLVKNTVVKGLAQTGAAVPVAGMTVSARRCEISTANGPLPNTLTNTSGPKPVDAGTFCSTFLGTTINTTTDATGIFTFSNLVEGVYEVTPVPTTVGGFTTSAPSQALYLTVGAGDVEDATFIIS